MKNFTQTNEKCPICGKPLSKFKIEGLGRTWNVGSKRCHCQTELEEQKKREEEQEKRKKYLEKLFTQSRLGEHFKNISFDDYRIVPENKEIFFRVKEYAENFRANKNRSIILSGMVGRGKTLIASAAMNLILKKGYSAIFVSVPDLFSKLFATYKNDSTTTEEQILRGLADCDLLLLDEIASKKPKLDRDNNYITDDWLGEKLFQIINSRYMNKRATIFTTNCDIKELCLRLGERTFSRMMEMSVGLNFTFSDVPNFRMQKVFNIKSKI